MKRYIQIRFAVTIIAVLISILFVNAADKKFPIKREYNHFGVKGTDSATLWRYKDFRCFEYSNFTVVGRPSRKSDIDDELDIKEGYGEDIEIRNPKEKCNALSDNGYLFKINNDNYYWFHGIYGNLLFLLDGLEEDINGIYIYDLLKAEKVFNRKVSASYSIDVPGQLTYWEEFSTATKENCPEDEDFLEKGGFGVIEKKIHVELDNFKVTKTTETRCRLTPDY